ncbi:lytic murein transglycosylase B [Marinobacter orientalis]|uniref:Lytic murein transglycosylase B n=1 Tax=Marinobacter orientalis TaxID=1928859 RepID=A0A7Y0RD83_9GAMM|nr:lytic murein transglycosylase B [Marinobacter orientalis]NMT64070.1 lytic murein transglycosylase B [Marinobacter orientalis]TGX49546.1 lytic murein transglycosylase B [Marinobacter orientalis]
MVWFLSPSLVLAGGYEKTPEGRDFAREMAERYGFEEQRVTGLLAKAERRDAILDAISRPAEKTLEWYEYRRIFMREERIEQGVDFLGQHREAFERAESEYGVPASVIAAIIGVETWYGTYKGKHRVLDALATLAFDYPPRSRFFRSELAQYLLMTREQGFDPLELTGSYAGAMGYGQFISSSYRHYAIDFDGDGMADIFANPVDAIGSVANYFRAHHWQAGNPVAEQIDASLPESSPLLTGGLKPELTVADYQQAGIVPNTDVSAGDQARAIRLTGEEDPELWLTYHNFYVITRYNHSHLYAMAVHQLAGALEKRAEQAEKNDKVAGSS